MRVSNWGVLDRNSLMRERMLEFEGRVDDWRVFSGIFVVSKVTVIAVGLALEASRSSLDICLM